MATLEALQAKIKKLQAQAEAIASQKSTAALESIRALMAKHNLTTADIDSHLGRRKPGRPSLKLASVQAKGEAKYLNPETGATWTGHGRAPAWIAGVKDRNKYLVSGAAASAVTRAAVKRGAGNGQPKGPQPAKYRNPETGATWSGRGPAPAWLAAEKDRSKFLVDGAKAAGMNGVARKKTAARKAARKSRA